MQGRIRATLVSSNSAISFALQGSYWKSRLVNSLGGLWRDLSLFPLLE
jgi:hypothetical protein